MESAIIDTTVQIKNIKYPHDAYLINKARQKIVHFLKRIGIQLHETYAKKFRYSLLKLWKYKTENKCRQRIKIIKSLKTPLGRLIRLGIRLIESLELELSESDRVLLAKVQAIYAQSGLSKKEKESYKENHKMIYSFHAP